MVGRVSGWYALNLKSVRSSVCLCGHKLSYILGFTFHYLLITRGEDDGRNGRMMMVMIGGYWGDI